MALLIAFRSVGHLVSPYSQAITSSFRLISLEVNCLKLANMAEDEDGFCLGTFHQVAVVVRVRVFASSSTL